IRATVGWRSGSAVVQSVATAVAHVRAKTESPVPASSARSAAERTSDAIRATLFVGWSGANGLEYRMAASVDSSARTADNVSPIRSNKFASGTITSGVTTPGSVVSLIT